MPHPAMTETTFKTHRPRGASDVGPYRLRRELGRGGQGTVWLAEHRPTGNKVALKLLNEEADALARARLVREAEAAEAIIDHRVCRLIGADLEATRPYLVFDLVRGVTLARRFASRSVSAPQNECTEATLALFEAFPTAGCAPTSKKEVIRRLIWIEAAARALHGLHQSGYVHRDVKPENLMVTPEGDVVLLDLGLATPLAKAERPEADEIAGTPSYMAPEQFTACEAKIDARTDVWSLGAVLFEAMTGMRPFGGAHIEALAHSVQRGLTVTPRCFNGSLPREMDAIVRSALSVDQARRPRDMEVFADAVRRMRVAMQAPQRSRTTTLRTGLRAAAAALLLSAMLGGQFEGRSVALDAPGAPDHQLNLEAAFLLERLRPPDMEFEELIEPRGPAHGEAPPDVTIARASAAWRPSSFTLFADRTPGTRWSKAELGGRSAR